MERHDDDNDLAIQYEAARKRRTLYAVLGVLALVVVAAVLHLVGALPA